MPYKSKKQMKFFNVNKKKIGKDVVEEFNRTSKGKRLPEEKSRKGGGKK